MEALMVKQLGALRPADDEAKELLGKVPNGGVVKVSFKLDRSGPQHRLFWKLCEIVAENTGRYSKEGVAELLKLATGHYDILELPPDKPGGIPKLYHEPKSIAYDKMDQTEFQAFFNAAIDVVIQRFLPVSGEALRREVNELLGMEAA